MLILLEHHCVCWTSAYRPTRKPPFLFSFSPPLPPRLLCSWPPAALLPLLTDWDLHPLAALPSEVNVSFGQHHLFPGLHGDSGSGPVPGCKTSLIDDLIISSICVISLFITASSCFSLSLCSHGLFCTHIHFLTDLPRRGKSLMKINAIDLSPWVCISEP